MGDDGIQIDDEAVASAVGRLIERLPRSSRLEDIAPAAATEPPLRERVADALASLVAFGLCGVSTEPVVCATRLAERPVGLARGGERRARRRRHREPAAFAPCGSSRFSDSICRCSTEPAPATISSPTRSISAERGELQVSGPDGRIEGRDAIAARLAPATDRCLESLLKLGLLEGE